MKVPFKELLEGEVFMAHALLAKLSPDEKNFDYTSVRASAFTIVLYLCSWPIRAAALSSASVQSKLTSCPAI